MAREARTVLALALGAMLALHAGAAAAQDSAASTRKAPRPRGDLITRVNLEGGSFQTAWDIVESLKNNWLRERTTLSSPGAPGAELVTDTAGNVRSTARTTNAAQQGLTSRSPLGENGGIQVYMDGTRLGGTEQLRTIPATAVQWIRHYTGTEAQARFGVGHSSGVIFVSTKPEVREP